MKNLDKILLKTIDSIFDNSSESKQTLSLKLKKEFTNKFKQLLIIDCAEQSTELVNSRDKEIEEIEICIIEDSRAHMKEHNSIFDKYSNSIKVLGVIQRICKEPKWEEIDPSDNHIMTLEDFKNNVLGGGFIDYDGFGNYAICKDGTYFNSGINIYPSDIQFDQLRTDMTHVIWYNR